MLTTARVTVVITDEELCKQHIRDSALRKTIVVSWNARLFKPRRNMSYSAQTSLLRHALRQSRPLLPHKAPSMVEEVALDRATISHLDYTDPTTSLRNPNI